MSNRLIHGFVNWQNQTDTFKHVDRSAEEETVVLTVEIMPGRRHFCIYHMLNTVTTHRTHQFQLQRDTLCYVPQYIHQAKQNQNISYQIRHCKVFNFADPRQRSVHRYLQGNHQPWSRYNFTVCKVHNHITDILFDKDQIRATKPELREHERYIDSNFADLPKCSPPNHPVCHAVLFRHNSHCTGAQSQHTESRQDGHRV